MISLVTSVDSSPMNPGLVDSKHLASQEVEVHYTETEQVSADGYILRGNFAGGRFLTSDEELDVHIDLQVLMHHGHSTQQDTFTWSSIAAHPDADDDSHEWDEDSLVVHGKNSQDIGE